MKIGLLRNFCGSTIGRMFISKMAGRGIGNFLDDFGVDKIPGCIQQGILTSLIIK